MSNSDNPIPSAFCEVLLDEDYGDQAEDDDFLKELEEVKEEQEDVRECYYVIQANGSLVPIDPLVDEFPDNDSSEEDDSAANQHLVVATSPLSSLHREPVPSSSAESRRFEIHEQRQQVRRGAVSFRGRDRGGCGSRGRGRAGRRGWTRGELLSERFVSDDELPAYLRKEVSRGLADREALQRRVKDDEERGEEDRDEEEKFFDAYQEFNWQSMDGWVGRKETFLSESCGPTRIFTSPYEAFRAYWDDNIMSHIVTESNRYAQTISAQRARFQQTWFESNVHEMFMLFSFWMMLGIIRMPSIKSCFSSMPILQTKIFRTLFTENRYWNLNAALHFASGPLNEDDPIHAIRPIINHVNAKCKELYNLDQEVSIDESLTLWKGPLSFKQYIKTKSARVGIKTYQLCESATGYLWNFELYAGRATTADSSLLSSVSTLLKLTRPVLNKGHTLFMDNFCNSPTLARFLKRNGTDCVGILRDTRKHVPLSVQRCPLAEGEYIARHSGDVMVMAMHDRKRTTFISTYHDTSQIKTEARPGHPSQYRFQLVEDYKHCMGGVDRLDQMLEPYLVERKQCLKWYLKFFKRILNVTIQNARILVEKSTNKKIDSLAFRLALVSELMEHHLRYVPRPHNPSRQRNNPPPPTARLTERHFIRRIPITEEMRRNVRHQSNLGRRRCFLCSRMGRSNRTAYECPDCEVALCLDTCFRSYHTVD